MQAIEVQPDTLDSVEVGDYLAPLTELGELDEPPYAITLRGVEFTYSRSVPVKGHGATLPPLLDGWVAEGRDVLIGRRGMRYYIYLTAATVVAEPAAKK